MGQCAGKEYVFFGSNQTTPDQPCGPFFFEGFIFSKKVLQSTWVTGAE
jgi:hypothetical protein